MRQNGKLLSTDDVAFTKRREEEGAGWRKRAQIAVGKEKPEKHSDCSDDDKGNKKETLCCKRKKAGAHIASVLKSKL